MQDRQPQHEAVETPITETPQALLLKLYDHILGKNLLDQPLYKTCLSKVFTWLMQTEKENLDATPIDQLVTFASNLTAINYTQFANRLVKINKPLLAKIVGLGKMYPLPSDDKRLPLPKKDLELFVNKKFSLLQLINIAHELQSDKPENVLVAIEILLQKKMLARDINEIKKLSPTDFDRAKKEIYESLLNVIFVQMAGYLTTCKQMLSKHGDRALNSHYVKYVAMMQSVMSLIIDDPQRLFRKVPNTFEMHFSYQQLLGAALINLLFQYTCTMLKKDTHYFQISKDNENFLFDSLYLNMKVLQDNHQISFVTKSSDGEASNSFPYSHILDYSVPVNSLYLVLAVKDENFTMDSIDRINKIASDNPLLFRKDKIPKTEHLLVIQILLKNLDNALNHLKTVIKVGMAQDNASFNMDVGLVNQNMTIYLSILANAISDYINSYMPENQHGKQFAAILNKLIFSDSKRIQRFVSYLSNHNSFNNRMINHIQQIWQQIESDNINKKAIHVALTNLDAQVEQIYSELQLVNINHVSWLKNYNVGIQATRKNLKLISNDKDVVALLAKCLSAKKIAFEENAEGLFIPHFRKYNVEGTYNFEMTFAKEYNALIKARRREAAAKQKPKESKKAPEDTSKLTDKPFVNGFIEQYEEPEKGAHENRSQSAKELKEKEIKAKLGTKKNIKNKKKKKKPVHPKMVSPIQATTNDIETAPSPTAIENPIVTNPSPVINDSMAEPEIKVGECKPLNLTTLSNVKDLPLELVLARSSYQHLSSVKDELTNTKATYDNNSIILRYHVIYHAIRLQQALINFIYSNNQLKHTPIHMTIKQFRHILSDRMDIFLDSGEMNPKILFSDFNSILNAAMRLYQIVERAILLKPSADAVDLQLNPLLAPHLNGDKEVKVNIPKGNSEALLTSLHDKIADRLSLFLTKLNHANELESDPFKTSAVKMAVSEIGSIVRRLRNHHSIFCGQNFQSDLYFNYSEKLFTQFGEAPPLTKNQKYRLLLPYLQTLTSEQCQTILGQLSLADTLTLALEVRNIITHDVNQDYQDYPEEVSTHLIFDIAKHITSFEPQLAALLKANQSKEEEKEERKEPLKKTRKGDDHPQTVYPHAYPAAQYGLFVPDYNATQYYYQMGYDMNAYNAPYYYTHPQQYYSPPVSAPIAPLQNIPAYKDSSHTRLFSAAQPQQQNNIPPQETEALSESDYQSAMRHGMNYS